MLGAVTEEQLHEVLAAMRSLVEADPAAAAAAEPGITPGVLAVWEANVTDPLVSEASLDLLQALSAVPACLASLQVASTTKMVIQYAAFSQGVTGCVGACVLVLLVCTASLAAIPACPTNLQGGLSVVTTEMHTRKQNPESFQGMLVVEASLDLSS